MKIQGLVWLFLVAVATGCDGAAIVGGGPDAGGMDAVVADVICATGQRSCGGRCVDPAVDPAHCGGCGVTCTADHACVAGVCEVRCPGTQAACSGQCVNLQTDGANCGACGRVCPGGQVCSLGRCGTTCDATLATCAGGDGGMGATYCADPRTDRLNCGACGNVCAAGNVCVDRSCQLSCAGTQRDCGGTCRDLATDDAHCGACGHACPPGNTCVAGACAVSCSDGLTQCGASCANLQTDNANCGACGTRCAAGSVCSGGACGATCASPLTTCGTSGAAFCADTNIDPAHCGRCGGACSLAHTRTQGCAGGECAVVRCATGYGDCDGAAPNGCETDTTSSAAHCGGCGRACLLAHATTACAAGECAVTTCDAGFADCDHVASNGCEVDTRTDNASCGACGRGCAAGSVCSAGVCGATCAAPLATCGAVGAAFCANTAIDPTNCGACGTVCALAHVTANGCAGGACTVARCAAGFGDCDGAAANGCETDLTTSAASCGACGRACALPNATATCGVGACAVVACAAGFSDCDGNPANGCEVDTRTDNASCGGCGAACPAATVCSRGVCGATCASPLATCGTAPSAFCANTALDPTNCGRCGTTCSLSGVAAHGCASGACTVVRCNAGAGDCNSTASDGCETNLQTSAASCGACGRACALPNASATCAGGTCTVAACTAGFADCDRVASNGCEVDTRTDNASCGACGVTCAAGQVCSGGVCGTTCALPLRTCGTGASGFCANTAIDPANCGACGAVCELAHVAANGCASGACAVVRCTGGYGDCDGASANGCETDLAASAASCGACGRACALPNATASCAAGACGVAACAAGFADCNANPADGCEVDTRTDNASCGVCGRACAAGQVCSGGVCGTTCASPLRTCGTAPSAFCTNSAIDPVNCGGCGAVCALPHVAANGCAASACTVVRCAGGYGDCDGTASNGCEVDLNASATSCGACGRACVLPHASSSCTSGACAITACAAGFANCNANPADGCEVDTRSDNANCGACGAACAGGTMCSGGTCGVTCQDPQVNCSGTCSNLASDPLHCGSCATVCPSAHATAYCAARSCGLLCDASFGDCDGVAATGCETDTRTSAAHCGACGRACPVGGSCAAGVCSCPAGQRLVEGACVMDTPPRPVAPVSLGDVTQRRPTLRWMLSAGYDGAVVELCRDRACTMVIETLTVTGSSARPASDLPPRSVVFWRMRGRSASTTGAAYSPVWLFHVPAVSASSGIDGSSNPHLDVNGDGFDDVLVGAYQADPGGRTEAGTASVFHGSAAGVAAAPARVLEGAVAYEGFGRSVADAGDVNGDGYGDLVVGVYAASPGGRMNAGTANVFHGSASGVGATAATVLGGVTAGDLFGNSVASAGDVNGDGYADLVVGAYGADPGGRGNAGTASVFHGSATGVATTAVRVFEGVAVNDSFGQSVAGAGDLNGDGFADIVVGAPFASPGGRSNVGTASVFHGSATGVAATAARVLEGGAGTLFLGQSVASAGDVNGDGYTDLIAGAFFSSPVGRMYAGTASVFQGSATGVAATATTVLEGAVEGDQFGYSVAGAGDVNGDGYADVVVGAYVASPGGLTNAGTASVFHGSASGVVMTAARVLEGAVAGDRFGGSVAGAGDLNGDGYADLIVGAYAADPGGRNAAGTASVYLASASGIPATAARVFEGVGPTDVFGYTVASAWDGRDEGPSVGHRPLRLASTTPTIPPSVTRSNGRAAVTRRVSARAGSGA